MNNNRIRKEMSPSSDLYAQLTWEQLEERFSKRILDRGERYQQSGRVAELARFGLNGLVARVNGSEAYVCRVLVADGNEIQSLCTCPYCLGCKHAVAIVLEYLECLQEKRKVPVIEDPGRTLDFASWSQTSGPNLVRMMRTMSSIASKNVGLTPVN